MIIDDISNLSRYKGINPYMEAAIRFLETNDLEGLAPGRIEIDSDNIYCNVNCQEALSKEQVRLESHVRYMDIQIPVSADEEMGYTPASELPQPDSPYNREKDVAFYPGYAHSYVKVKRGMFAIFLPGEGHAPAITANGIRKIVIKLKY